MEDYLNSIIMQLKEENERMKDSVRIRENIYRNTTDEFSKRSHRRQIDILNATMNANRHFIKILKSIQRFQ